MFQPEIKRNKNNFQYATKARYNIITERTWNNLRVEYINEQAYQFALRAKLEQLNPGTKKYESTKTLIENSCERCRSYDFRIQAGAKHYNQSIMTPSTLKHQYAN